jgi:hypothetical protein
VVASLLISFFVFHFSFFGNMLLPNRRQRGSRPNLKPAGYNTAGNQLARLIPKRSTAWMKNVINREKWLDSDIMTG